MMRGDEGSLKGVEQKVHATEFAVKSYISLRITRFSIHRTQCHPANTRVYCEGRGLTILGQGRRGLLSILLCPLECPLW